MNWTDSPDEKVVAALAEGNHSAFNELYSRYGNRIYYFFYKCLKGDVQRAKDLTQDLFIKLIENPNSFDPKRVFKTWFFSVANNLLRNDIKKQNLRNHLDLNRANGVSQPEIAHRQIDGKSFGERLDHLLTTFSEDDRTLFILRFREELTIPQIAEIMQIKEGTVKSRLHKLTKHIGSSLSDFRD